MGYLSMLSQFGVGSAHPGGFAATLQQLQHFQLPLQSKILEVGCGTGRTACYLAAQGYDVTAMDLLPSMVAKAKQRATSQQLQIHFVEGDVCAIPFDSNQFDIIIAESVTNFTDIDQALSEYERVLKFGGTLYDREMLLARPIPEAMQGRLHEFFGIKKLLTHDTWLERLKSTFGQAASWGYTEVIKEEEGADLPDDFQVIDDDIFSTFESLQTALEYHDIMSTYAPYLATAVLIGTKT